MSFSTRGRAQLKRINRIWLDIYIQRQTSDASQTPLSVLSKGCSGGTLVSMTAPVLLPLHA